MVVQPLNDGQCHGLGIIKHLYCTMVDIAGIKAMQWLISGVLSVEDPRK